MNELEAVYKAETARRAQSPRTAPESIAYKGDINGWPLFCIEKVRDLNVRETSGFAFNQDLYLWPEEAQYLIEKGQAKPSLGKIEARTDI